MCNPLYNSDPPYLSFGFYFLRRAARASLDFTKFSNKPPSRWTSCFTCLSNARQWKYKVERYSETVPYVHPKIAVGIVRTS